MKKRFFKWSSTLRFLCVLLIALASVSEAWGVTYYYGTGRVVAKRFGGTDANFGEVACKVKTGAQGEEYTGSYYSDYTFDKSGSKYNASGYHYIHCYAHEIENSGYSFEGWYLDEACETPAGDYINNYGHTNAYYMYKYARSSIPQESNTSQGTAAVVATLYAKFVKGSTTNKFQSKLTVSTESTSKGVVDVAKTGVDLYGTGVNYFDEYSLSDIARGKDTKTITADQEETEETSTTQRYYVYAQPLRGYQFAGWTESDDSVALADSGDETFYSEYYYLSAYDVSVSTNNRKTNGVYGYTGTLTATFEELGEWDQVSFTIQKEADKGSVAVSYANWEYDGSSKIARKKAHDLEGMSASVTEKTYSDIYTTDEITLTAVHADGYEFEGWFVNDPWMGEYLYDDNETTTVSIYTDGITITPRFHIAKDQLNLTENDKFLVGFSACQTFEQALAAATNSTSKTILQLQDYTISRGSYNIPEGVTLVITKNETQTRADGDNVELSSETNETPSAYCTLTLENGANLDVYGTIEVSGTQNVNGQGVNGVGHPHGTYGKLVMKPGSHITINSGAKLYAWGFVTGDGTTDASGNYLSGDIDVRRNGEVREQFQMMDWKGGTRTTNMLNNAQKVFPVNQYFIQNVEVPATYRPGSRLFGATGVNVAGGEIKANVQIMGISYGEDDPRNDIAMFLMDNTDESEDTWVRKRYDAKNDLQVYEVNNSAHLGSITIGLAGYVMTSTNYILPLTNNMKIHLLSGNMDITQDAELLPGAELEIDKQCTFNISTGKKLYVYDAAEWGGYAYNGYYGHQVLYTAVHGDKPNKRAYTMQSVDTDASKKPAAAAINIHGTLEVRGGIYTTASGANVFSSIADAGTVLFLNNAVAAAKVYQTTAADATPTYGDGADCTSAQLKNGAADSFEPTTSVVADIKNPITYCYLDMDRDGDGEWVSLTEEDCFVKDGSTYYIKPQDYVALKSEIEDEHHLYYSADETRTFIITTDRDGNCQWWEVEPVEGGLMHCIHPEHDVYYFYDEDSESDTYETWQEKRFNVTFKNWDGTKLTFVNKEDQTQDHYELRYGSMPQWYGSNPTRETDPGYYTYDFIGWYPVLSPVTADVEYTAQYEKKPVLYAITFNDADGNLIEVTYCRRDEMPVCQRHTLADGEHWEPALGLVTGAQAYQLSTTTKTDNFTIKFVNWDGSPLDQLTNVAKNTIAEAILAAYDGPEKPAKSSLGDEEEYTFAGWTPEITAATADAVYTATFTVKTIAPLTIINQQTIADEREVTELIVTTSGTLNVTGSVTATNFILESNGNTASGQLLSAENVTATHAYFDLKLNAQNHNWYAVAVPWQVDATNGISVNGRTLTLGKDFDIIYYSGERRASEGKNKCWNYVEDDGDKTLYPGRLYMIGLMGDASTIRFAKKSGSLLTTSTSVTAYASANAGDANWNGVANPALFHAFVNPGATAGQIYNSANKSYEPFLLNEKKLVVGQGVYVQAPVNKDITVTYGGAYAAPRRARSDVNALYDVRIAPAKAAYTDRLFVQIDEEKETESYVIGQDLSKVGVSKKVAQMWINRYNTELCMNTIAPVNGVAEYPLGISVPANGEYTISNVNDNDDYTLYLTLNGQVIWNLSNGAYTLTLSKGASNEYGLRLVRSNAPQTATGIDEAVVDAQGETKKVLINDKVFIIRNNNVYSVDGQMVK